MAAAPATLADRARAWRQRIVDRRTPRSPLPVALTRRRLYILPTRSGAMFAVLLVVMLLGATNYGNSLAFALTFWLGAVALVSMHHAHANLVGLSIEAVEADPVFAGQPAIFDIVLHHRARRSRRAVRLRADGAAPGPRWDIEPDAHQRVGVEIAAPRRGRLACPRLCIDSLYPLAMFRAWGWLQPQTHAWVYPQCAGEQPLPRLAGEASGGAARQRPGSEEFSGHRPFRDGDSPRHIDWKASARSHELRLREYSRPAGEQIWLDYDAVTAQGHEARLSQLARWVVDAERAGLVYGLALPGERLSIDQGPAHSRACLQALALA